MTQPLYLTDRQVAERYGVSRTTIWLWKRKGDFPKAVRLSAGMTRWRLSDIEAWEASREMRFAFSAFFGPGEPFGGAS